MLIWDTGDILSQRKIEITSCDTTKTLTDKLSQDGGASYRGDKKIIK